VSGKNQAAASHVNLRLDFNPVHARAYRLLSSDMQAAAGLQPQSEMLRGENVTALYEIVPSGLPLPGGGFQESKYQPRENIPGDFARQLPAQVQTELLTVSLRYQIPGNPVRHTLEKALIDENKTWQASSANFRQAAAAAGMGLLLHQDNAGALNLHLIRNLAAGIGGGDPDGAGFAKFIEELALK
jgi:hypothetical protein